MNNKDRNVLKRSVQLGLVFALAFSLYLSFSGIEDVTISQVEPKEWEPISIVGDGDPGVGASGVLKIFIYPHQADPGTAYASNISSGWYAHADYLNNSLTGEVPYDTAFDIVVKVRGNATHAYNTTSNTWMWDWIRSNLTCADLSISANTSMEEVNISYSGTYIWGHYYLNNGGAGYTISHGESVNVTYYKFEAYY